MTGTTAIEITGRKDLRVAELLAVAVDPIRWTLLTQLAAAWVAVYWVNGWLWDTLLYNGFGMGPDARLSGTLHFLAYDTIEIALLLVAIIFIVTVLRSYMSIERTRALLGGKREGAGNVTAAWLGVIIPFCFSSNGLLHRQLLSIGSSRETSAKS